MPIPRGVTAGTTLQEDSFGRLVLFGGCYSAQCECSGQSCSGPWVFDGRHWQRYLAQALDEEFAPRLAHDPSRGLTWRSESPEGLQGIRSHHASGDSLMFAVMPAGPNGNLPERAQLRTDQIALQVEYRLP